MTPEQLEEIAAQLKSLSDSLSGEATPELPPARAKRIRKTITEAYQKLRQVVEGLDPIKHPSFVFDPANPNVVGRLVGITMIAQPRKTLVDIERFYGSGVYAIYYKGDFSAYQAISKREHPIYVGKADPANPASKTAVEQGDRLSNRLNDHRKNIAKATSTLRLEDFEYRALVVQSGWQEAAETYLIHLFKPIWNSEIGICYGFGKHGDDPGTRANLRSPWDTLHPGRDWAHRDPNMKDAKPQAEIAEEIATHFATNPPFEAVDEILRRFLDEMRGVS
jgi:hypothetical protein